MDNFKVIKNACGKFGTLMEHFLHYNYFCTIEGCAGKLGLAGMKRR